MSNVRMQAMTQARYAHSGIVRLPAGEYATVVFYAAKHDLSPATVRRRCADGTLPACKFGREWLIQI